MPFPPPSSPPQLDPARRARNWRAITIELDAPRASPVERSLRRVGVPSTFTRLSVATPALRRSWFVALALVLVVGLGVADSTQPRSSLFALLFLAPLVPVLGVALAYGAPADPSHEIHVAAPMSSLRLLLTRTLAILAVAAPIITGCALLVDVSRPWAAAWILPSLAVTATAIALMTITTPTRAASVATGAWVLAALTARRAADDELAAFVPAAQLVALAIIVAAMTVVVTRRDRFESLSTT